MIFHIPLRLYKKEEFTEKKNLQESTKCRGSVGGWTDNFKNLKHPSSVLYSEGTERVPRADDQNFIRNFKGLLNLLFEKSLEKWDE